MRPGRGLPTTKGEGHNTPFANCRGERGSCWLAIPCYHGDGKDRPPLPRDALCPGWVVVVKTSQRGLEKHGLCFFVFLALALHSLGGPSHAAFFGLFLLGQQVLICNPVNGPSLGLWLLDMLPQTTGLHCPLPCSLGTCPSMSAPQSPPIRGSLSFVDLCVSQAAWYFRSPSPPLTEATILPLHASSLIPRVGNFPPPPKLWVSALVDAPRLPSHPAESHSLYMSPSAFEDSAVLL